MEILFRENLARIARFKTPHGEIETPTVMPVINPNLNFLDESTLRSYGVQAVITNSYIIKRNQRLNEDALRHGLHSLIKFSGPIMTDSGTFQSHVYGDIEYSNKEIVDFQKAIGSDIITILDVFTEPDESYNSARSKVIETYKRLKEIDFEDKIIAGPVQGSIYPDLRRLSAYLMSDALYLPIGGVVPLLESYRYSDLVKIIFNSKVSSDFSRPVHLFGGGHPMFFAFAVMLGVDLFDSASYIKYAKDNRLLYSEGTRALNDIREFPEWSPIHGKYTPQELLHEESEKRTRMLALHNLKSIFIEINEIKERIYENTLYNYVEEKARSHPALFKAFMSMINYDTSDYSPLSYKSPFFYYDKTSLNHPIIKRIMKFTENYISNSRHTLIISSKYWRPGVKNENVIKNIVECTDFNLLVSWNGIYIPLFLEDSYPVQQLVSSGLNDKKLEEDYLKRLKSINNDIEFYEGEHYDKRLRDYDTEKINTIAMFQFNINERFFDKSNIIKSKSTGHIRNIIEDNNIIATMRNDGYLTLSIKGAYRLLSMKPWPGLRVVVDDESGRFNANGYNVFFKFIKSFDTGIIPGNETLVVSEDDDLYAVGKAAVSGIEMYYYKSGVAVKVHEGVNKKAA
ncbi:tRNA guanosine(15) transglycosylase TgtA [Picrophilus oshimae]|uniref:tRNA-guanine(15) transglycosylase n=1 Tax=Picrophilus torridus (strain ATCC 700027 / DSM 9790 / JCM 10055 / NBRC 100828 / KAW 2/3) TaxID=1122961 RepID=ATGT_PICTO|nr:tRNA guanosine(15) transglycosylase TgtA [Picrophilus oshimae]Q6L1W3.1 RecName: Full=tRNA-guanine(15) transglycosylase; AltName: Full=7-cyano-7-deazaguanine tRNA-ribosyltransferase; AltName: Full=Archaeal tRNA-guanine transglycosylase [Picrophilus oshimae DSM 9789]AAT43039.1 queunine/archaeosine tRNA-ribosyltransferase [Picrophilus oshimae DSM 9789]